jgi:hypothetical protein
MAVKKVFETERSFFGEAVILIASHGEANGE